MERRSLRVVAAAGALVLCAAASVAIAAPSPKRRARVATTFVVRNQSKDGAIVSLSRIASTADAAVALSAARRAPGAIARAIGYLRAHADEVDLVGEKAKVVMALVASGRNHRRFEGRNLVKEIRSGVQPNGRYGDTEFSYVFDQALAILALTAAGAPVHDSAFVWLAAAQCGDGGWQFDQPSSVTDDEHCFDASAQSEDFNVSDTNTTSMVIQAFAAAGQDLDFTANPYPFFATARDPIKKGWVFAPQFACSGNQRPPECSVSDANSTALVIQAYMAGHRKVPNGGHRALSKLQYRLCGANAGAFAVTWVDDGGTLRKGGPDLGATVAAILGILRKPLPVQETSVTRPAPHPGPC